MARYQDDAEVKCPFYQNVAIKSITCEGITDDCVTKILFTTSQLRGEHCNIFCTNKYENCEIYQMLWRKYED